MPRFVTELIGAPGTGSSVDGTNTGDNVAVKLDGCVLGRIVGSECDIAAFTVIVPQPGEYGLKIFVAANDEDNEPAANTYRLSGQYLIVCRDELPPNNMKRFPKLSPG